MHHVLLNQVLVPVPVGLLVPGERVVSVPVGDLGLVPVPVGDLGLVSVPVGDLGLVPVPVGDLGLVVSVPVGDPGLVPVPVGEVLVPGLRVPSVGDLVRLR